MKDTSTGTIILCCQSLGWAKSREEKFCMVCKYFNTYSLFRRKPWKNFDRGRI